MKPLFYAFAAQILIVMLLIGSPAADATPAPLSIDALRATRFLATLTYEKKLDDGPAFTAYLVSYQSAGLKVHAMVAVPLSTPGVGGFPVLVANHGFHPDPPRYGVTAAGIDSRPGDYYRSIPALYAKYGFMVVIPDYRGHNNSEGREFSNGPIAVDYYTEDVLALLSGLSSINNADLKNVFMWGHSLGGIVSLRTLLVTNIVKAATLWSSGGMSTELLRHLVYLKAPMLIHHAVGDTTTAYRGSELLANELQMVGRPYRFYTYTGSDHFFKEPQIQEAVERDVQFFRGLMSDTSKGTNSSLTPTTNAK